MGTWAGRMVITKEFREDSALSPDEVVGGIFRRMAEGQGYHPAADPVLSWHEITQRAVDFEVAINGTSRFRAGDWLVRATLEVAESAEIGS